MKVYIEKLAHMQCEVCACYWAIGDAPLKTKKQWYCTWCGHLNTATEVIEQKSITETIRQIQ